MSFKVDYYPFYPGLLFITYYNIQKFHLGAMKSFPVKN